jgi:hypothetical protein
MAAYNSYTNLIQSIQEVSEDDGVEFLAFVPKAIEAAELRLTKEVDTIALKQNVEIPTVIGNREVEKISGFRFIHDVFMFDDDTGEETRLKVVPDDYLRDYWPIPANTAKPRYFAQDYDTDAFLLAPTPDKVYTLRLNVAADLTPIGPTNATNYFTDQCGEVLFYAAMVEMMRFMKNAEGLALWEQTYSNAIQALNNQGRRARRDDGFPPLNPSGGQNTLKGDH